MDEIMLEKANVPEYFNRTVEAIMGGIELAHDAGYLAITTNALLTLGDYKQNGGAVNAVLWSLNDSGYIFCWSVVIDGRRQHAWSFNDKEPVVKGDVFCG